MTTLIDEIELATNWGIKILFIEHDERIIKDLKYCFGVERQFSDISFAGSFEEASELIKQNAFQVISSDYMFGQKNTLNGIEILKKLSQEITNQQNIKKIIYSQCDESDFTHYELQNDDGFQIEFIRKTLDHDRLFNSIKNHHFKINRLPKKPRFAFMNNKDFILKISSDLIEDLSSMENQDELLSFSSDSEPIRISELITNILDLTPLGKEYLGNWFFAQRRSIKVYERQLKKLKNL